ncbi:MAG: DNA polymerase IV [Calditrichia bacterium]
MEAAWSKIIVHVDMDAFFASVEELLNPEWKGKPVIVGADPQGGRGRGVVAAASYASRKFGVHSAMPISKAYKLCSNGIFVRPHGHVYGDYSRKIFAILDTFSPVIQPLSIDEAFLDMGGSLHLYQNVESIGIKIKSEIKSKTGLTASVGIAPSKSVAKIASDFNKPDGLTIVPAEKVQEFLDPLPVTRLWGIGEKTFEALRKLGIHFVYQLRTYPPDILEQKFGKMGEHIYRMARGEDHREVISREEAKSVSNELTFDTDQEDITVVRDAVFALSEKVSGRLRRGGICGKTVHLKFRIEGFKTYTRSRTLANPTNLTHEIFNTANAMLSEFDPLEYAVRLVGVGVSNLSEEQGKQLSIWDADNSKKMKMEKVMDLIQDKFGKDSIRHAQSLAPRKKNPTPKDKP